MSDHKAIDDVGKEFLAAMDKAGEAEGTTKEAASSAEAKEVGEAAAAAEITPEQADASGALVAVADATTESLVAADSKGMDDSTNEQGRSTIRNMGFN